MPQDYRRFNGPDTSVPYYRYTKDFGKTYDDLYKELFNEHGLRRDGRTLDQGRSWYARPDLVSQAKGSSYVEMKKTKVVCSVFDPREIPRQNEYSEIGQIFCEVKFAPFSHRHQRRLFAPEPDEKALSAALKDTLEPVVCRHLFPNTQIDIFVYILENDGACLSAAINAAGLALTDAAVPMYDLVTACSLAFVGDQIFIDPTEAEEYVALLGQKENKQNHGVVTMSMLYQLNQVVEFDQIGSLDAESIVKAMEVLEEECKKNTEYIQQVIVKNVLKNFELRKELDEAEKIKEEQLKAKVEEWKELLNS